MKNSGKNKSMNLDEIKEIVAKFNEREKETEDIRKRLNILDEEMKTLSKALDKLNNSRYEYSDKVMDNHRYWSNEDGSAIARIIDDEYLSPYVYLASDKDEKDRKYITSSRGILFGYPIPITEEKYYEIYNRL